MSRISRLLSRLNHLFCGITGKCLDASQKLEHREQRIAFEELLEGIRQESERMERLEDAIREVGQGAAWQRRGQP